MAKWDDLAKAAMKDPEKPITAQATNITKYGAPAAGIITSLAALVAGDQWDLDPSRGEVGVTP